MNGARRECSGTYPGAFPMLWFFGSIVRRTSAPFRGAPCGAIRRVMASPYLSACRPSLLAPSCTRCGVSLLSRWGTGVCPRPQRGCHVPHRQDALGELASLRRELGTVSARPLTPADRRSIKDVSTPFVPSLRYDVSIKASQVFNSCPTFPRIDFGWGSLLSFCLYGLLETPRLLTTPRPYGNRRSVLAWSAWFRHLTYATSCRTSDPRI
jgi:hypothetical protein